jgi:hypothetical protein
MIENTIARPMPRPTPRWERIKRLINELVNIDITLASAVKQSIGQFQSKKFFSVMIDLRGIPYDVERAGGPNLRITSFCSLIINPLTKQYPTIVLRDNQPQPRRTAHRGRLS